MKLDPLPHTKPTQNGFRAKLKNLRRKYWGKFLEAGLGNDTFDQHIKSWGHKSKNK